MEIHAIGHHHKHDGGCFLVDRPAGTGDWLLILTQTASVFRLQGKEVRAAAGSFLLYTPDYPQYYYGSEKVYCDDWMHFAPSDAEAALIVQLGIPENTPVRAGNCNQISALLEYMEYEHKSGNRHRTQTVDACFRMLLYKLGEAVSGEFDAGQTVLFPGSQPLTGIWPDRYVRLYGIRETIYRWPGKDWAIDEMAAELSLSRSHFQHIYARTFGISVNQDIIRARLEKAAELLAANHESIMAVGRFVGYKTHSYFCRQFKAHFGMTPEQYREQAGDTRN